MANRFRFLTAAFVVALAGTFAIPEPADARGSRRRNYADEWKQEEREEERREERERARREYQEHQDERQKRYLKHRERQLDTVIDYGDRVMGTGGGGAPPPPAKKSGTCIYGDGDKVLYQPKGVVCSR